MRLMLLATAVLGTATVAVAQDGVAQDTAAPPSPAAAPAAMADARARLLAADVNHDGKWDKAEWLAAGRKEKGFARLDTDKDGFVTQEELKAGMARMHAMRGEPQ